MAGAPVAAAELAPPLTYTDASGIERPISEWEGSEQALGSGRKGRQMLRKSDYAAARLIRPTLIHGQGRLRGRGRTG